jgi:hypothetical protein
MCLGVYGHIIYIVNTLTRTKQKQKKSEDVGRVVVGVISWVDAR